MAVTYLSGGRIQGSSLGNKQNYLRLRSTSEGNYRATLDLQTKIGESVANTWVIRFTRKLTGGGATNGGSIGTHISYAMTSTDYTVSPTGNSSQGVLGLKQGVGDGGAIGLASATLFPAPDNWSFANAGGLDFATLPNTYYFEIIRSGATGTDTLTANVYTTSDYSGSAYGTGTKNAANATVRYFSIANYDNNSNQGLIEAEIRDFKFWQGDGSSVPSTSGTVTYTATFDTGEWDEQNNSKIGAGFYTSTDEKTTVSNVPVGTRYEETDTRKIFRRKSALTFEDDLSSNKGWSQTGSIVAYDGTDDNITGVFVRSATQSILSMDLQDSDWLGSNPSDTSFVMRFSADTEAVSTGSTVLFGFQSIVDAGYDSGTNRDTFMIQYVGGDDNFIRLKVGNNTNINGGDTTVFGTLDANTVEKRYFEFIRNGNIFTVKIYDNANYSGSPDDTATDTVSGISGLRFFTILIRDDGSNSSDTHTMAFDDFKFYDGVTNTDDSWVEKGTA